MQLTNEWMLWFNASELEMPWMTSDFIGTITMNSNCHGKYSLRYSLLCLWELQQHLLSMKWSAGWGQNLVHNRCSLSRWAEDIQQWTLMVIMMPDRILHFLLHKTSPRWTASLFFFFFMDWEIEPEILNNFLRPQGMSVPDLTIKCSSSEVFSHLLCIN